MVSQPEAVIDWYLQPMGVGDLDRVLALEREGQDAPWSRKIFEDCLRVGYDCRMILAGNETVGFIIISRVLDEAHLLNIVIDRQWRGYGIARGVLERFFTTLRDSGISLLYLEVRESNQRARRLYEQLGFRETGYRRGYYRTADGGRESAVLMTRELAPAHK